MSKKIDKALEAILLELDEQGDPVNMSKTEWKELLQGLRQDVDVRLEAVNEELGE